MMQRICFKRTLISLAVQAAFMSAEDRRSLYADPFLFQGMVGER